jgi:alpha-glucuronidase
MGAIETDVRLAAGYSCWLRRDRIRDAALAAAYVPYVSSIRTVGAGPIIASAREELKSGISDLLGRAPAESGRSRPAGIVLGTLEALRDGALIADADMEGIRDDGFLVKTAGRDGPASVILSGKTESGALYAAFRFMSILSRGGDVSNLSIADIPKNRIRMLDHWDNMDGSVERGYAGRSIFFRDNAVVRATERIRDYARLLSSVGINAVAINNVNVHFVETRLITAEFLWSVARLARVFRAYGISLFLSVNYAAPIQLSGFSTADPLDAGVRSWWRERAAEIYRRIPDFGGFVVKADSEGRPGPFTYGRTHADGANMLAEALAPHGGLIFWRCFVYNCRQDWRDRSTDRARAAYDHFKPLDGRFADNVLLQIKNGPVDFQAREAVSPLFGGLSRTNQALELQVTQEYTGQQKHLCFLVPQWKEYFDFETYALAGPEGGPPAPVKRIVDGSAFHRPRGGVVGVSNVGNDPNWTGHDLAQANLYGYGRLAWDPDLSAESIAGEWTELTFGTDPAVRSVVSKMLLESWSIYESYTAPLGVGWMVNPGHHYGPNVDGYEYDRWGTYHFADSRGIGVDRTVATGTGYTKQYIGPNAGRYEALETCPDELLLFFHHVPYTHRLRSGKTVIQHIYDGRFEGVDRAALQCEAWDSLRGKIEDGRWTAVRDRLEEQRRNALEWRDIVNTYFLRKSGIGDEKGRKIY